MFLRRLPDRVTRMRAGFTESPLLSLVDDHLDLVTKLEFCNPTGSAKDRSALWIPEQVRDLAPELVLAAQNVTDDIDHAVREGTSSHLTEQRVGNRDFVHGTLGDLLTGRLARDPDRAAISSRR